MLEELSGDTRLAVKKTYKLFIGGKFPRTESGRYYPLKDVTGKLLANVCLSSRKDFRNAVVAARKAFEGWAACNAYLRGQIIYRVAEILEGRSAQFEEELCLQGIPSSQARKEVETAVDTLVYYAGWTDKFQQIFGSVNPVASSHFSFSLPEPTGVIAIIAPEENGLLGLIHTLAPVIAGGNTCVTLASHSRPLCAVTLAEVLNCSDVPAGVVNILTGERKELLQSITSHMDVNAVLYSGENEDEITQTQANASLNVKRLTFLNSPAMESSPYRIMDFQEIKTTWHPIGI